MREKWTICLALLTAGSAAADVHWSGDHAGEIVLGMSAAFQGTSQALGSEIYRGARACFDEVNERGGVHGRKIVIKAYNDGYNPGPTLVNTRRLIEEDRVLLLFGYVGTPTIIRVLPVLKHYQAQEIKLFFPFTGADMLREYPYDSFVYNLRASYRQETAGLVERFVRVGRKKIAVFYQIDVYGRSGWDGVRAALKQHGLSLAAEATYKRGTSFTASMREQVEILRRADADAVICIGTYNPCAALIRDARDAGWNVPIANLSFVGSESLLEMLMQKGAKYTENLINTQVVPSYNDLSIPAVRDYRAAMEKYRPEPPPELQFDKNYRPLPLSFVGFEGYLDAKLLVEILQRAGRDPDRFAVSKAADHIKDYSLGLGADATVTFRPDDHQGLNKVYFTVVRGGRFLPLSDDGWKQWQR